MKYYEVETESEMTKSLYYRRHFLLLPHQTSDEVCIGISSGSHIAGTGSQRVFVRAAMTLLFVVGVASVIAIMATDHIPRTVSNDDDVGWLLPAPNHVLGNGNRNLEVAEALLQQMTASDVSNALFSKSDCRFVADASSNSTYLTSGWSKAVYVGEMKTLPEGRNIDQPKRVAIKTVDVNGRDVRECIERRLASGFREKSSENFEDTHTLKCRGLVERKLVKEAYVLQALDNNHIVKLIGVCLPPTVHHAVSSSSAAAAAYDVTKVQDATAAASLHKSYVTMVTELGAAADFIRLLQMSWEDRLKVIYDLTRLLHYLARTPFGSVALNDFRRQQFVLVDKAASGYSNPDLGLDANRPTEVTELKLVDVDDVGFDEPTCAVDDDCLRQFDVDNVTISIPCSNGRCVGYNELKNVVNAGRHFVSILLAPGSPRTLRPLVNEIVAGFSDATPRPTDELLPLVVQLARSYADGTYLDRRRADIDNDVNQTDSSAASSALRYSELNAGDLPGLHDYRCRYSIARSGCTVTVYDRLEAEELCDFDDQCRAFVLSSRRSWTGRQFAHLKNGVSAIVANSETSLYVRPSQKPAT